MYSISDRICDEISLDPIGFEHDREKGKRGRVKDDPRIAQAAREARCAIEDLLVLLGWGEEPALSRAIDRLIQLEEGCCR